MVIGYDFPGIKDDTGMLNICFAYHQFRLYEFDKIQLIAVRTEKYSIKNILLLELQ
jgi:hypothetical protein